MNQNSKIRIYIYAMFPFILGIFIFVLKMINAFGKVAEKEGEEKSSMLAQALATSLWFPITGFSLTFIWLIILMMKNIKRKE